MRIEVLDLGINNLKSLVLALERTGSDSVEVIQNGNESHRPNLIVLPGVGSFGAGMQQMHERNFVRMLENSKTLETKILGICLGMQLLGEDSEESPAISGLGLIAGSSRKLPEDSGMRLPNMGWYPTTIVDNKLPFNSLNTPKDFYFVHSYTLIPSNPLDILCTTEYGNYNFVSGVANNKVLGLQFHPEKSAKIGNQLLSEIVTWARA